MDQPHNPNQRYQEPADFANGRRQSQYDQMERYIEQARKRADEARNRYFQPNMASAEAYSDSLAPYRQAFTQMLGWPLTDYDAVSARQVPQAAVEYVAADALSTIYRMEIEADEGLSMYGLFFVPHGDGPFPLVIGQHGGSGTPELCAGFYGPSNYNDMITRLLRHRCVVFAPQLHLWTTQQGPENKRNLLDNRLKQLGSSITAVELFRLRRSLDYLQTRPEVDASRIGMAGLSYGGFYTLFMAAADTRIRAALSSCFFNDRYVYDRVDWTWRNSAGMFLDAEVAGLICPRPLYIEVGLQDELFEAVHAKAEALKVIDRYARLNISERFRYREFQGKHEFGKSDEGIEFLMKHLSLTNCDGR